MAAIGDLVANIRLDNSQFKRGAADSRGMLSSLGRLAFGATTLIGGFSAIAGLKWGAQLSMQAEQAQISFEVLLGSADQAKQMLSDLKAYSDVSPFGNQDVNAFAQDLLNYGIAAGDIMPDIRMLGDVAAGDKNKFEGLSRAFGQMSSTGRLMGQDLNQFINAGFNPLQEIAAKTGESMATLKKRMEAGGVSVDEVKGAFVTATSEGGRFFGMTERQAQSMQGRFSTLKDNVGNSLKTIAESIMTNLDMSGALDRINAGVSQIPFYFNNAGSLIAIEIIDWQLQLDEIIPGAAQTMADIGIVFQAGWAAAGEFFSNFLEDLKNGFAEILNLSKAVQAAWDARQQNTGGWQGWAKSMINDQIALQAKEFDSINAFFGGSKTFVQDAWGTTNHEVGKNDRVGMEAFNKELAGQKDVAAPGSSGGDRAMKVLNDTIAKLVGNGGAAGDLGARLQEQKANLMWRMAEQGDQSGYGSAGRTKLSGGKAGGDGTGNDTAGKEGKDTATNKAALKGSAEAASILTRGAFTDIPKQQVELSKVQVQTLKRIDAQLRENARAAKFDMNLALVNL